MKKALLTFSGLVLMMSLAVLSCKKDDPQPTSTTSGTTTSSTSGTTTSTTSGTTTSVTPPCSPTSNTLTLGSTVYSFNTFNGLVNGNQYLMAAMTNMNYPMLNFTFDVATVTTGIYDIALFASAPDEVSVLFSTSGSSSNMWTASSGQVYVNVSGSSITCTICNVGFTDSTPTTLTVNSKVTKP